MSPVVVVLGLKDSPEDNERCDEIGEGIRKKYMEVQFTMIILFKDGAVRHTLFRKTLQMLYTTTVCTSSGNTRQRKS